MGRMQEAVAFFQDSLNLTLEQASGIVGNLVGESNLDPRAVGDNGTSFGLAQWRGSRLVDFKKFTGKDIRESSFEDQLAFIAHELRNKEKAAFSSLLGAGTIADATRVFMKKFERPANDSSLPNRVEAAEQAASGGESNGGGISGAIGSVTGSIGSALTPDWLEDLLSGATAARWTSVIIGIILIALAIAAFVFAQKNNLVQSVTESVTS